MVLVVSMACRCTTYFYARKIAREDGLDDQKSTWYSGWRNVSEINTILKQRAEQGDPLITGMRVLHIASTAFITLFILGIFIRDLWLR